MSVVFDRPTCSSPLNFRPTKAVLGSLSEEARDYLSLRPFEPITNRHALPSKPYKYGQHREAALAIKLAWEAEHPFDPMP